MESEAQTVEPTQKRVASWVYVFVLFVAFLGLFILLSIEASARNELFFLDSLDYRREEIQGVHRRMYVLIFPARESDEVRQLLSQNLPRLGYHKGSPISFMSNSPIREEVYDGPVKGRKIRFLPALTQVGNVSIPSGTVSLVVEREPTWWERVGTWMHLPE